MTDNTSDKIGQFLQGEKEPSSSWVILVIGIAASLSFLVIYNILYPGQESPSYIISPTYVRRSI